MASGSGMMPHVPPCLTLRHIIPSFRLSNFLGLLRTEKVYRSGSGLNRCYVSGTLRIQYLKGYIPHDDFPILLAQGIPVMDVQHQVEEFENGSRTSSLCFWLSLRIWYVLSGFYGIPNHRETAGALVGKTREVSFSYSSVLPGRGSALSQTRPL